MFCKYGLGGTLRECLSCSELERQAMTVFVFLENGESRPLDVDTDEDSEASDEKGDGAREALCLRWDIGTSCGWRSLHGIWERQRRNLVSTYSM